MLPLGTLSFMRIILLIYHENTLIKRLGTLYIIDPPLLFEKNRMVILVVGFPLNNLKEPITINRKCV